MDIGPLTATVNLALELANALDIKASTSRYPADTLVELSTRIGSTALLLRRLSVLLREDAVRKGKTGEAGAIKDEGVNAVHVAAGQCETVYKTIIANFNKSTRRHRKTKWKAEDFDNSKLSLEIVANSTLARWVRPRIQLSLDQLNVVRVKLLVMLQVMSLAKIQVFPSPEAKGKFEEEMSIRSLIGDLRRTRFRQVSSALRKHKKKNPPPSSSSSDSEEIIAIEPEKDVISSKDSVSPRPPVPIPPNSFGAASNRRDFNFTNCGPVASSIPPPPPPPPPPSGDSAISNLPPPYVKGPPSSTNSVMDKSTIMVVPSELDNIASSTTKEKIAAAPEKNEEKVIKDIVKKQIKGPEVITLSAFQKQFGKVDSWIKELFGPSSLFFDDKPSDNLEAFMVLGDKKRLKVPFGARRLKFGMKRMMKLKKESTMDDFAALPKHLHTAICDVVRGAKISDSRERVLICFDVLELGKKLEDQHILVFLSAAGPPMEPIHFKCAVGRKYDIPYFMATPWEEMCGIIKQMFLHVDVIGTRVVDGHYDVVDPNGAIILPSCWDGNVKPGMVITMHMWPMDTKKPPPRPYCGPGPGPPMFPRAGIAPRPPAFPRPGVGPGPNTRIAGPSPFPRYPQPPVNLPPPSAPPLLPPPGHPRPPFPPAIVGRRFVPVRPKKKTYYSDTTDSSDLWSDSDIEAEECDLGIKIDLEQEKLDAKTSTTELLVRWTNAIDIEGGFSSEDFLTDSSSSSSSSSGTSLAND